MIIMPYRSNDSMRGRMPSGAIAYNRREPSSGGIGKMLKTAKPIFTKIAVEKKIVAIELLE